MFIMIAYFVLGRDPEGRRIVVIIPAHLNKNISRETLIRYWINKIDPIVCLFHLMIPLHPFYFRNSKNISSSSTAHHLKKKDTSQSSGVTIFTRSFHTLFPSHHLLIKLLSHLSFPANFPLVQEESETVDYCSPDNYH